MHGPKNPSGTGNQVSNPDLIAALDRLKGASTLESIAKNLLDDTSTCLTGHATTLIKPTGAIQGGKGARGHALPQACQ
jgi:hypothetical protein